MLAKPYDLGVSINELIESMHQPNYAGNYIAWHSVDYAIDMYCGIYNNQFHYLARSHRIKNPRVFCAVDSGSDAVTGNFYIIAQNRVTNLLHKKITERVENTDPSQLDLMGNRKYENEALNFKLFIQGYTELTNGVSQSATILLDCLMITATKNGLRDTLVELPLKDYMNMRELRNEKETRKQVKRDITALERISFEYRSKNKKNWFRVRISGGTSGIINGVIIFCFSQAFFDSFKEYNNNKYFFMYFPCGGLKMNINDNRYSYWLLRKIAEHKRMNMGEPNADVISVKTLIDACPNYPTIEAVRDSNRAFTKRLIEPFERDMERLEVFFKWEYAEYPNDYTEFMATSVRINWRDYPDTTEVRSLIARKAARKKRSMATQKRGVLALSDEGGSC